jgi:lysozyme
MITELEGLRDKLKTQLAVMAFNCKKCQTAQKAIFEALVPTPSSYKISAVKRLMVEEGFRSRLYKCPAGKQTIGFGYNLDDTPITYEDALYLLESAVNRADESLQSTFSFYPTLSDGRKEAMLNMVYCMGANRLKRFKRMITALEKGDYDKAADEVLNSKFHTTHKARAERIAEQVRNG